ncbi:MAG: anti-sigma regulatory factor [Anaerolineales bacterium]|nr:anti-sigma regulatory factor [Anaerolineales bacterium]
MNPLTVPGKLDALQRIAAFVLSAARQAGLDDQTSYRLRLAVDEIATNIVTHGYREAHGAQTLTISAEMDEAHLTIYLEDHGPMYDPTTALDLERISKPPEKQTVGGLGIYLALLWGVDQFKYQRLHHTNRSLFRVQRGCKHDPIS